MATASRPAAPALLRARDVFWFPGPAGAPVRVVRGQVVAADDPAVSGREHLFEPFTPNPTS